MRFIARFQAPRQRHDPPALKPVQMTLGSTLADLSQPGRPAPRHPDVPAPDALRTRPPTSMIILYSTYM
jgi:hypothetical protein